MFLFLDFKQTVGNDDGVDDLPGSAVELESKNKVMILNSFNSIVLCVFVLGFNL